METLIQKPAPAFKAQALVGEGFKEISLADYKGKWLCLFFYPLDFTFVCPTEITAFSDMAAQFREKNCEVVGCSVDSQFSHLAWSQRPRNEGGLGKLDIPLLADIKKEIARDYGVLIESAGVALRGCYLIDPDGKVAFQVVHDLGVGRNPEEICGSGRSLCFLIHLGGAVHPQKGHPLKSADPTLPVGIINL